MASQSSSNKPSIATQEETSVLDMDPSEFEALLHRVHREAKQTAALDSSSDNILLAKLVCYAIRQLHTERIYPATAIRAMAILEYAEQPHSTGGAIKQAKREARETEAIGAETPC